MTTTKTKTPTTYAERVAASKAEHVEAEAAHDLAVAAHEAVVERIAQVRQGRRAGDPDARAISGADLAALRAQVDLSDDDVKHAEIVLARAARRLLNDDTSVAEVVAAALRGCPGLPKGVEIIATAEAPEIPDEISRPVLYLVQTTPAVPDTTKGRVAAEVSARLHRPTWGSPLDLSGVDDRLTKSEIYGERPTPKGTQERGDVCEDSAEIHVRAAWPALPVISRLNGAEIYGQTLAGQVARHLSQGRRGEASREAGYGRVSSSTALTAAVEGQGEGRIIGGTHNKHRERVTEVEIRMALRSGTVGNNLMASESAEFLRQRVGTCAEGLGRVKSVELRSDDSPQVKGFDYREAETVRQRVLVTFVSVAP